MAAAVTRPRRVLVIDDHQDTADALAACLRAAGHTVEVANEAVAGIESARRFKPQVIFCDISLPGIDGYYVAGSLKDDPDFAECYIVAISGHEPHPTRAGRFAEYLRKPIESETLLAAVERAQAGRNSRPGAHSHRGAKMAREQMSIERITSLRCTCERCGHRWVARNKLPARCARCKSPNWDRPRIYRRKNK